MGVDITGERGVVISADMLFDSLVNEETRADVCGLLIDNAAIALSEGGLFETEVFLKAFSSLQRESSVAELRAMFVAMTPFGDGEFGGYVENEEEGLAVWGYLLREFAPAIPRIERAICITNPRYQGNFDLPQNTLLFVFSEEKCFTKRKTDAGRQLDIILGQETELSTWTTYSC